jgi:hypothetical protein
MKRHGKMSHDNFSVETHANNSSHHNKHEEKRQKILHKSSITEDTPMLINTKRIKDGESLILGINTLVCHKTIKFYYCQKVVYTY